MTLYSPSCDFKPSVNMEKKPNVFFVHTVKINGVQCGLDHNILQNISQMKEMHTGLEWHLDE